MLSLFVKGKMTMVLEQLKCKITENLAGKFRSRFPAIASNLQIRFAGLVEKEKVQVGLDIGSYYLKLVELTSRAGVTTLSKFAVTPMPDSSSNGGFSRFIHHVIAEKGISAESVNISVSGPDVVVRYILLPRMGREELKGAIGFEAEKHIPFDMKEVILDSQVLEPEMPDNRMRVLLVAAKKELVEKRMQIVREAGLEIGVVDVDSFALINSFLSHEPQSANEVSVALLDIGDKRTSINILRDGRPFFTREISIGGEAFTRAVCRKMKLKPAEAVSLKHESRPEKAEKLMNVVEEVIGDLAKEIRVSFSYFENESGRKVEKVFLSGGTARLAGLASSLASNLEVEVERWDPVKSLTLDPGLDQENLNEVKDLLPVAIGLARRG